jgi:hypothetical protein
MPPKRPRPPAPIRIPVAVVSLLCVSLLSAAGHAAKDELKLKSVADFAKCADQYEDGSEVCLEALTRFVKAQPGQAFAAGKAVRARMNHAAALPFFATALTKKPTKAQCSDPDLQMAVLAGLATPPGNPASTSAREIVLDKCWNETQTAVLRALTQAGGGSYFAENLCPKLTERKVTNPACETKPPAPHGAAAEPKWRSLDPKTIQVDGPAKAYRGPEGESVVLAKIRNEDAYLVKFDGIPGEWNGRVILHREAPAGSGSDYFTDVGGARWVSLVVRDGDSALYPHGGKGPIHVRYDESASKSASAQHLLDQLRQQK